MSYDPGTFEYMETNWKFALVPEVAKMWRSSPLSAAS